MKFLTLADWTGMVESKVFAATYKSYGLATVRYPVLKLPRASSHWRTGVAFRCPSCGRQSQGLVVIGSIVWIKIVKIRKWKKSGPRMARSYGHSSRIRQVKHDRWLRPKSFGAWLRLGSSFDVFIEGREMV
jgi:hypothetical protein